MAYKNKADQAAASRRHYLKNTEVMKARARAHKAVNSRTIKALLAKLKSNPCLDCGKCFPTVCMDFDHARGKKEFTIAAAATNGCTILRLLKEIEKCELVCANCHRVRTYSRLKAGAVV